MRLFRTVLNGDYLYRFPSSVVYLDIAGKILVLELLVSNRLLCEKAPLTGFVTTVCLDLHCQLVRNGRNMSLREYREDFTLFLSAAIIEYIFPLTSARFLFSYKKPKTNKKIRAIYLN